MQSKTVTSSKSAARWSMIALCLGGLLINLLGVQLVKLLRLPLYLDNIGSALIAALGGYIPGIIVGFLTNIINGVVDIETTYYGSLTVLIALASAFYASKGFYEKPSRYPIIILTFALIGGGIGSVLTFMLYGLGFGEGVSAPLAN